MLDAIVSEELLGLVRHVRQAAVSGDLLGDVEGGEELPEPLLQLPGAACAGARELHRRPATEPVDNDEVVVATQLEVVRGQLLEGVVWALEWLRWCAWL